MYVRGPDDRQWQPRRGTVALIVPLPIPMKEQTITSETYQEIYTGLGYLFYSIAAADGRVQQAETQKLKELIARQWVPLERSSDELGTDAAYYIEFSFDDANDQDMRPVDAFARFKTAYEANKIHFDASLRELTFETAQAVAFAFARQNKSELGQLAQLALLFEKP